MKATRYFLSYSPFQAIKWGISILFLLLLVGCDSNHYSLSDEKEDTPNANEADHFTVEINPTDKRVGLAQDENTGLFYATWHADDKIQLFFVNSNGVIVRGQKKSLSSISTDKRSASFTGRIPDGVTERFTLIGIVGIDSVTISTNQKELLAIALPRAFEPIGETNNIPMICQIATTKTQAGNTPLTTTFSQIGALQLLDFENNTSKDITLSNISLNKAVSTANDWFHNVTSDRVPFINLVTGAVTMVAQTSQPATFTPTTVSAGSTVTFAQWIAPVLRATEPELKLEIATSDGGTFTSFNTTHTVGHVTTVTMKRNQTRHFVSRLDEGNLLSLRQPYIVETNGVDPSTLVGGTWKRIGNTRRYYNFDLTESKWFAGLTRIVSYGQNIETLNYQRAANFSIDAGLIPKITSLREVFKDAKGATFSGIEKWNTEHITDMHGAFSGATAFNNSLRNWDVSNVTDMSNMFEGATRFNQPIGAWDVSAVTDMGSMFKGASAFNQALADWQTGNVTDMSSMFEGATRFNQPIGAWDVSAVTDMNSTFKGASAFNQALGDWQTGNVTDMGSMFEEAARFNQPIGTWDVSNVTDMNSTFKGALVFNQALGDWQTGNVTDMSSMFEEATRFNQPIGTWDVSNVTDMSRMFYVNIRRGKSLSRGVFNQSLENWKVSNVKNMSEMFYNQMAFNQPIGAWDVSNVTDMSGMFQMATNFNQPIGEWNVGKVTNMSHMFALGDLSKNYVYPAPLDEWTFENMRRFELTFNHSLENWDVSKVTDMSRMFYNQVLFNQPLSLWNVSKVTNMSGMFAKAARFDHSIGDWDVSSVTDMSNMFAEAFNFNQPIGSWNVSKVTNMSEMFACYTVTSDGSEEVYTMQFNHPIGDWDVSSVTSMRRMFAGVYYSINTNSSWDPIYEGVTSYHLFSQDISGWQVSPSCDITEFCLILGENGRVIRRGYMPQPTRPYTLSNPPSWMNR